MLKGVPTTISPELMYALMKMGHGDEIVLADGNFPADSHAQRIIRADGLDVPLILTAILKYFPVDTFVPDVACVMKPVDPTASEPPIWSKFRTALEQGEGRKMNLTLIERNDFYVRAKKAYAVVATSETALYANLILKKGVVVNA
ncbi:MAG: RbsD/FucU domain-containing protein [Planctomycetales bacterium]